MIIISLIISIICIMSIISPVEILELHTKKDILKIADQYSYKLKSKTKETMKKELLQYMHPDYTIETKTIHIILDQYDVLNGKIIYKGNDGLFYDSQGRVVAQMAQNASK